LRLAVVDRIEEVPAANIKQAAGQLRVQLGEAILPLAGATLAELGDGKVRLFRLNDGRHEIGYAFAEVVDFATIANDVIHAERPGEISGVSLINDEPAELVDAHWLFANHVSALSRSAEQLVCRLPTDDPWMQNMLRPIVEAAGYRVVGEESEDADLVIAAQGDDVPDATGKTIWLRPEPEAAGKTDESIYRYDRAGLLMALKSAGTGRGK
jgi:two-component system chemotaxis sensor kinase CheA